MKVLQQITVPQESVNDQYLTVVGIPFATGDFVKKDSVVIELETSKAILTLEADVDGYVEYFCVLDEEVGINKLVVQIIDTAVAVSHTPPAEEEEALLPVAATANKPAPAAYTGEFETQFSKSAQQLIAQNNIDKSKFANLDFVSEEVVLDFINPGRAKVAAQPVINSQVMAPAPVAKSPVLVDTNKADTIKIKSGKKREIEYLSSVQGNNLVSTIYMEVELGSFFESVNPTMQYFKDSVLPVFVYETAKLLIKYPVLNAFFYDGSLVTYKEINIGVAMDIDDGLKVVKIPNTSGKGIVEIENELFGLSNKYLDKKLETTDLTDITFTITDLSSQGAYFFSPLVNKDNGAILGIGKTDKKLNKVIISLSFDHRVTEGKTATVFLHELKERIESYSLASGKINTSKITCYKCMKQLKDDLNSKGFIKVVNQNGDDKFICDSCLFNY